MKYICKKILDGVSLSNGEVFEHLACRTHQKSYKVLTRIYKVCEAQICRWKKIMPHNQEEMVTQISTFTSQMYKFLWGLTKSDKIMLPREVSLYSPPDIYTLPER